MSDCGCKIVGNSGRHEFDCRIDSSGCKYAETAAELERERERVEVLEYSSKLIAEQVQIEAHKVALLEAEKAELEREREIGSVTPIIRQVLMEQCGIETKYEIVNEEISDLLQSHLAQLGTQKAELAAELKRVKKFIRMEIPGTFLRCGDHFFAHTRGDEQCPVCLQIVQLEAQKAKMLEALNLSQEAIDVLTPFKNSQGMSLEQILPCISEARAAIAEAVKEKTE